MPSGAFLDYSRNHLSEQRSEEADYRVDNISHNISAYTIIQNITLFALGGRLLAHADPGVACGACWAVIVVLAYSADSVLAPSEGTVIAGFAVLFACERPLVAGVAGRAVAIGVAYFAGFSVAPSDGAVSVGYAVLGNRCGRLTLARIHVADVALGAVVL